MLVENPIASYNLVCLEDSAAVDSYFRKNPNIPWSPGDGDISTVNLGAFVFTSDVADLLDASVPVSYIQRHNASTLAAMDSTASKYGGSHNKDISDFFYLLTWQLQLQLHFEDSLVYHRAAGRLSPQSGTLATNVRRGATWSHYDYGGKDTTFLNMTPLYLVMIVSTIVCELLQELLMEKEYKFKMNLQIAGLNDWSYWATWWKQMMTTMTGLTVFLSACSSVWMFSASNVVLICIFFFTACASFISLTLCISSCLFSAAMGSLLGTAGVWVLSIPGFMINSPDVSLTIKYLVLLSPPCAYTHGLKQFANYELPVDPR